MSKLNTTTDQKILRQKSKPILDMNNLEIQELIEAMFMLMKEKKGAGLAAIQTGTPLRLFIVDYKNEKRVFINPEIKKISVKKSAAEEGCLSVPDVFLRIERSSRVEVEAIDRYGKKFNLKANGMLARIIQHEIDHLDGIIFTDKFLNS